MKFHHSPYSALKKTAFSSDWDYPKKLVSCGAPTKTIPLAEKEAFMRRKEGVFTCEITPI